MRRASRDALRLMGCAAVLVLTLEARAGDQLRILDGKQIVCVWWGKTSRMARTGRYISDQTTQSSVQIGESWTVTWKIRDDRLCMTQPSITSPVCNEVWMSGANIRMRAGGDDKTLDAMVMAHQPDR
ncbi:hypothetical protein [Bradyrhizobium sp. CW1]|uniref:hypothetical protein n=1 Tax=Bradyrhizobium sp. CW1 TaxID=2782686 RepID=UPI001FFE6C24|nr:hypothetical protein [Bradyrhizobium sp. CW1]